MNMRSGVEFHALRNYVITFSQRFLQSHVQSKVMIFFSRICPAYVNDWHTTTKINPRVASRTVALKSALYFPDAKTNTMSMSIQETK